MQSLALIHGVPAPELAVFVKEIAYALVRRLPPSVMVDDLISAGHGGLLEARDRFNPALGQDFKTYAQYRIRGAMLDVLRALDHLSRDQRAHAKRLAQIERELVAELGRSPEDEEIARALGLSLATLYAKRVDERAAAAPLSFDKLVEDGEEPVVASEDTEDVFIRRVDARRKIERVIGRLDARRARVVTLYYGEGLKLREIGDLLGVTESRVCQILKEAREIMRAYCAP